MEIPCTTDKGRIFMTCTMDRSYTWENVLPQHVVAFIYSGELFIAYGNETRTFVAGETVLVAKNQLSRIEKRPVGGMPFRSVSMALSDEQLRKFYLDRPVSENWSQDILKQRPIKAHSLLEGFFGSLLPYFDVQDEFPEKLVDIKTHELLTIIDAIDKRASAVLGTFAEMGKVDLKKYMEAHYMYNLPLERFAFLTGRSLTTFKSDFKKIFKTTPGKWLMEKRLDLAHHKLTAEKRKTSDVYLSAGFENLSHFSFAFKKAFGYSPSSINQNLQ